MEATIPGWVVTAMFVITTIIFLFVAWVYHKMDQEEMQERSEGLHFPHDETCSCGDCWRYRR